MIATQVSLLVVCLYITLVKSQTNDELKCMSSNNNAGKVSIVSRRNHTGHIISKVGFEHAGRNTQTALTTGETNLWTVDVEKIINSCEGVEYTSTLVFTIIAPFRQPDPGYELFPGIGYYKFHEDVATWPRAREICAEEGAHLVIINSEQESDVTKKLFARYPKVTGANDINWAWVGAKEDEVVNGQYVTIYGVNLNKTGFARWSPTEPNNPSTQGDYLLVNRHNGGLADIPKNSAWNVAFICEQELW